MDTTSHPEGRMGDTRRSGDSRPRTDDPLREEDTPFFRACSGDRLSGYDVIWESPSGERSFTFYADIIPGALGRSPVAIVAFVETTESQSIKRNLEQAIQSGPEVGAAKGRGRTMGGILGEASTELLTSVGGCTIEVCT